MVAADGGVDGRHPPIIVLYFFTQKTFIQGITVTGLTG